MPLADFDQLYRQADARPARQSPPWRGRPDGSQSAWRSSRGQEFPGRVAPGDCSPGPPGPPSDPDFRRPCIHLEPDPGKSSLISVGLSWAQLVE